MHRKTPSTVTLNYLNCEHIVAGPDQGWATDITYIRTWQGWLDLTVFVNLFARWVLGWPMKPTLARNILLDALLIAVWRRKPKKPALVHFDRGSQQGSDDWLRLCGEPNFEPSMSRRGNCWDNAVVELFSSSLKKELIKKRVCKTRDLAHSDIFDYIEMFYNQTCPHSHLGGINPEAFNRISS